MNEVVDQAEVVNMSLALASQQVGSLLVALDVKKVISVDDAWTIREEGESAFITELVVVSEPLLAEIVRQLELLEDDEFALVDTMDPSAVNDYLTREWTHFTAEVRKSLHRAAQVFAEDVAEEVSIEMALVEIGSQAKLKALVGSSAEFLGVGLAEWRKMAAGVSKSEEGTLVLFDRDFSNEPGGQEDSGETMLRDLLQSASPNVRAGMLTRTVLTETEELDTTRKLEKDLSVKPGQVVVVGKFRLEDGETVPAALRVLLLAIETEAFLELALRAIKESHDRAAAELSKLQRYTVVGAIASARVEGTYELDQPLRLVQRVQERALLEVMRDHDFASQHLPRLRNGSVEKYAESGEPGVQLNQVLRADIFVQAGLVNELGLAVEIGDIFEFTSLYPATKSRPTGQPKQFILLAQSCDLSMRSGGKRAPDIHSLILHEFRAIALDSSDRPRGAHQRLHPVGPFIEGSTVSWGVNFGTRVAVPAIAIDATVFNADGAASIRTTQSETRPMSETWLDRQKELHRQARTLIAEYVKADQSLKKVTPRDEILLRIGASLAGATMTARFGATAIIKPDEDSVEYGVRRVGRVASNVAAGLVSLATSYDGRPAFESEIVVGA